MSLSIALNTAVSGLQVNQRALDTTAQNIANVNTEGYSRKIVQQVSAIVGDQGAGVRIGKILRSVNEFMIKDLRGTLSQTATTQVADYYHTRMQDLFGSPASDSSLSATITELATRLQALAANPEDVSLQTDVVARAESIIAQIRDTATKIQALRVEAEGEIGQSIAIVNESLATIERLNEKIAQNQAFEIDASELIDQRDLALNRLAEQMDIRYYVRDNGEVAVFAANGRVLVDQDSQSLSHAPTTQITPNNYWPGGGIDGIHVDSADITAAIGGGRLAGLIAMRDTTLPNLAAQFDELAVALHDEFNAVHNRGTAFPGVASLTGTRSFAAGDTPGWTGTLRIAALDAAGRVTEVQDFNLAAYATVGDLLTAIDGMANVNASLDGNGRVVLAGAGGNHVAINEMTSAVALGGRISGASQFLGLNDLVSSGNDYDRYTSAYQASRTTAFGLAGTLTFRGVFGTTNVAYGAGTTLDGLAAAINGNATLSGAGIAATVVPDGGGFRLRVIDAGSDNFFVSDSGALAGEIALKTRDMRTAFEVAVRADIMADPSRLARGTLSADPLLAVGERGVTTGDNTVVQALANRFGEPIQFRPTGGLGGAARTFGDFASSILSLNATQADATRTTLKTREFLVENLKSRATSVSGVNLDEEMANMIVLQNAYTAAARVITVTQELFDTLEQM